MSIREMNFDQTAPCPNHQTTREHQGIQEASSSTADYGGVSSILQRSAGLHEIIGKAVREANGNLIIVATSVVNDKYDLAVGRGSSDCEVNNGLTKNNTAFLEMVSGGVLSLCIVADISQS